MTGKQRILLITTGVACFLSGRWSVPDEAVVLDQTSGKEMQVISAISDVNSGIARVATTTEAAIHREQVPRFSEHVLAKLRFDALDEHLRISEEFQEVYDISERDVARINEAISQLLQSTREIEKSLMKVESQGDDNVIIVVPKYDWEEEFEQFSSNLRTILSDGELERITDAIKELAQGDNHQRYTIQMLERSDKFQITKQAFVYLENGSIANLNSFSRYCDVVPPQFEHLFRVE